MSEQEKTILELDEQIPATAGAVFAAARARTLASGQSVLESDNGAIYEVFPDGTRKWVKAINPPFLAKKGQIIQLR